MINVHIWEVQRTASRINSKIYTHSHHNENADRENLESSKGKMTHHVQQYPSKIISLLLIRNDRGQKGVGWHIQSAGKKLSQELHPIKPSFKNEGEINSFLDFKQELREFTTSRPALGEILAESKLPRPVIQIHTAKTRSISEGNCIIIKDNICAYFFSLTNFKSSCIKLCVYSCIVEPITYRNVIYLTITGQRKWVDPKLYWSKEIGQGGNSNWQESVKKIKMVNKRVTIADCKYLLALLSFLSCFNGHKIL